MGLIKATAESIGSTLHNQWKDVISCENMSNDLLMKGVTTDTGAISKNSLIRVMPGQCAIIMQNGKVLDASAEEGDYIFDESTEPSFFTGNFGAVFKEMWRKFTYGGVNSNRQTVYYFNTKEIIDNKFGTAAPVPYQDWSHPVPNKMTGGIIPLSVRVKCFGKYTFKIVDPSLFMNEIAGTAEEYTKEMIVEQIRVEVMSAFQNILNELGTEKYKVPVLELPSQTDEIKTIMDERVYDEHLRRRGLAIVVFAVESVTLDEKSEEDINNYIMSANSNMQQGTLIGAYASAIKDAANNANGASNGFMGIGMMNMASGGAFGVANKNCNQGENTNLENNSNQDINENNWKCSNCGQNNNQGNFCVNCGVEKFGKRKCPKCNNVVENDDKFCPECGEKLS